MYSVLSPQTPCLSNLHDLKVVNYNFTRVTVNFPHLYILSRSFERPTFAPVSFPCKPQPTETRIQWKHILSSRPLLCRTNKDVNHRRVVLNRIKGPEGHGSIRRSYAGSPIFYTIPNSFVKRIVRIRNPERVCGSPLNKQAKSVVLDLFSVLEIFYPFKGSSRRIHGRQNWTA